MRHCLDCGHYVKRPTCENICALSGKIVAALQEECDRFSEDGRPAPLTRLEGELKERRAKLAAGAATTVTQRKRGRPRKIKEQTITEPEPMKDKEEIKTEAPIEKPATKVCKKCGRELPLSEFGRHYLTKDGLQTMCHDCFRKKANASGLGKTIGAARGEAREGRAVEKKMPLQKYSDAQLVQELRDRGFTVTATKTIDL